MKIEEHWMDAVVYNVSFVPKHSLDTTINKMLILNNDIDETEIYTIISKKFNNVDRVISILFIGDGLVTKNLY